MKREKQVKDALNTYTPSNLTSYETNGFIVKKIDSFEDQRLKQIEDIEAKQLKYKESLNRRVMRDEAKQKLKDTEMQNNFSRETLNNRLRNYTARNEIPVQNQNIITNEIKQSSAKKYQMHFKYID